MSHKSAVSDWIFEADKEENRAILRRPGQLTAGFTRGQRSWIGSSGGEAWNLKQQEETLLDAHTLA